MIRNHLINHQKFDHHPIKRLTFTHHKGGTGKTTSCLNIAGWLARMEHKVLVIDMDPQASATTGLGVDLRSIEKSMCDVLLGYANLNEVILKTRSGVYLAPALMNLMIAEAELVYAANPNHVLYEKLKIIGHLFDFILIDSPPGSNILMVNSLVAAKNIIITMDTGVFSYETLEVLNKLISNIEQELEVPINIVMTLLKKFSPSLLDVGMTRKFQTIINTLFSIKHRQNYNICPVPFSKKIYYAQMKGLPISHYAPYSRVGKTYQKIAKNIIKWNSI